MKNLILALLLTISMVSFTQARGYRGGAGSGTSTTSTITEAQKASILYIYQEEKVARDVYITLGKLYPNERTFSNIQISEQKHMDAVENLCIKYGIDISGIDESVVGEFVLPELQELYNTLISEGQESLLDALYVGQYIEILDIADLEEAAVGMPRDVKRVFIQLRNGSLNHLAAFENAIARVQ